MSHIFFQPILRRKTKSLLSTVLCSGSVSLNLWPNAAQSKCCCGCSWVSVFAHFGSAAAAGRVSTIPCCTFAWQKNCPQFFQACKWRLVNWHVAASLASLSLSWSFVMKECSPRRPLHRGSFTLKFSVWDSEELYSVQWTLWCSRLFFISGLLLFVQKLHQHWLIKKSNK